MTANSAYINVRVVVHQPGCPDLLPPPDSLPIIYCLLECDTQAPAAASVVRVIDGGAAGPSETLVHIYHTIRRHTAEDSDVIVRTSNLKSLSHISPTSMSTYSCT
jgi:hypothetical protein